MTRPLIVAHRGASAHAPENTLAAFRMAMAAGAQGLEFDVRLAKDGVPVVIHDDTLGRTASKPAKVLSLPSGELSRVDVGSWFNRRYPALARAEFSGETVPTLANVMRLLRDFQGLIYVELKAADTDFRDLAAAVCDTAGSSKLLPQIIIKSFKLAVIPEVKHLLPKVRTSALFAREIMHFLRRREHMIALAHEFGADGISVHRSLVTPRLCRLASDAGMPVTVWTVDDPRWLARRSALKIDALITNDPQRFLS
jgi:glycerophosphoryl diester phosphodiesterase